MQLHVFSSRKPLWRHISWQTNAVMCIIRQLYAVNKQQASRLRGKNHASLKQCRYGTVKKISIWGLTVGKEYPLGSNYIFYTSFSFGYISSVCHLHYVVFSLPYYLLSHKRLRNTYQVLVRLAISIKEDREWALLTCVYSIRVKHCEYETEIP